MKRIYSLDDFGVTKHEEVLKNGLRTIFIHKPFAPIHATILMRAGSNFDPTDKLGLAHLTEHLLAGGSNVCYKEDFWGILESVGGFKNASTGSKHMSVQCEVAIPEHMPEMKKHFTHALGEMYCTENELQLQKSIIIAEISDRYSKIERKENAFVNSALANGSNWHRETLGTIDTVESLTKSDVEGFFESYCCVENMVLVIVGGCTWDDVEKTFSTIVLSNGIQHQLPEDPKPITLGTTLYYDQDTPATKTRLLFLGPENGSRENLILRFALAFAHDGLTSQFYKKIRNQQGKVYSIQWLNHVYSKLEYIGTQVMAPRAIVDAVYQEVLNCYRDLLGEGISQSAIDAKVRTWWFSSLRSMQKVTDWINMFYLSELYPETNPLHGTFPDIHNYRQTYTSEEVTEVLRRYINLENSVTIFSGKK